MYKRSADFKRDALDSLRGKWGISLVVSLIVVLLGGDSSGSSFSYNLFNGLNSSTGGNSIFMDNFADNFSGNFPDITAAPYSYILSSILATSAIVIFVFSLAWSIIGASATLGHKLYYTSLIRREAVRVDMIFSRFTIWLKAWGLSLFTGLFIFLWSLLLIIPGIIAAYRYSMAPYIMSENPDIGIREAVDISKDMMNGNKGRLFVLELSFIGWAILASFTLGIGFLWLNPYMEAARASFYLDVSGRGAAPSPDYQP
ncbi:MAG: DUF975 family protein [Christensenellales bacterium]|jgi:uncharacterized membrane protein